MGHEFWPYMQYFNSSAFDADFLNQCLGKQHCNATVSYDAFNVPEEQQTFGQFSFVQVACSSHDDQIENRNAYAILTACIGLFICLLYHHTISYINAETNINEKLVEL